MPTATPPTSATSVTPCRTATSAACRMVASFGVSSAPYGVSVMNRRPIATRRSMSPTVAERTAARPARRVSRISSTMLMVPPSLLPAAERLVVDAEAPARIPVLHERERLGPERRVVIDLHARRPRAAGLAGPRPDVPPRHVLDRRQHHARRAAGPAGLLPCHPLHRHRSSYGLNS